MGNIAWYVQVDAPSGTGFYGTKSALLDGQQYDARLVTVPRIERRFPELTGGLIETDDVSFKLNNIDKSLLPWIADPANDIRNKGVRIYTSLDGASPILRFSGHVSEASAEIQSDMPAISIRARADSERAGSTLLPQTLFDHETFGFGFIPDNEKVTESLGLPIPAPFYATRGHVKTLPIRRAPNAPDRAYDFLVGHEPFDVLCRTYVNTVYRNDNGNLRVSRLFPYVVDYGLKYTGYTAVIFQETLIEDIYVDTECTEFAFRTSNVKRQYLFRGDLRNEIDLTTPTLQLLSNLEFDFRFNNDLVDSGGSNTLTNKSAGIPTFITSPEDFALSNPYEFPTTPGRTFWELDNSGSGTIFDPGTSNSFFVLAFVSREDNSQFLNGWLIGSFPITGFTSWSLGFVNGRAQIRMDAESPAASIVLTDTQSIADGNYHRVAMSVDRDNDIVKLIVDDVTVDSAVLPAGFDIQNDAPVTLFAPTGTTSANASNVFIGKCERVLWYSNTASDGDVAFANGQSEQSLSTLLVGPGSVIQEPDDPDLDLDENQNWFAMIWVRKITAPASTTNIVKKEVSLHGWSFQWLSSGILRFNLGNGGQTTNIFTTDLADDLFHQIYITYNTGTSTLTMYVDGRPIGTRSIGFSNIDGNGQPMIIGPDCELDELVIGKGAAAVLTDDDVAKQYFNATGNPAYIARRVIENDLWGIGQGVDKASMQTAADEYLNVNRELRIGGALEEARPAREYLSDFTRIYGGVLKQKSDGDWVYDFTWKSTAGLKSLEFTGGADNVTRVTSYQRTPPELMPERLLVRWERFNSPEFEEPRYAGITIPRDIVAPPSDLEDPRGNEHVLMPYLSKWVYADKVGNFYAEFRKADQSLIITASADEIDAEPGDKYELFIDELGLNGEIFIAKEVQITDRAITLELFEDAPNALVWSPTTQVPDLLPSDIPDYRFTAPERPSDLILELNQAVVFGAQIKISFIVPEGQVFQDVGTFIRVSWKYVNPDTEDTDDPGDDAHFNWVHEYIPVQALTFGERMQWISDVIDADRRIRLVVVSMSRFDLTSFEALTGTSPATVINGVGEDALVFVTEFNPPGGAQARAVQSTAVPGTTTRGEAGLDARIKALEGGGPIGGGDGHKHVQLSNAGFDGTTKIFDDLLPSEPDLTSGRSVFIVLQNEWLVADPDDIAPAAPGTFLLTDGTTITNGQVEFYRAPFPGEIAVAIYVEV